MAAESAAEARARRAGKPQSRWLGDLATLGVAFGILGAVYLLPADTSLSEVQRIGALTACTPTSYPPLVTGNADEPGFDVEVLREVARRLGVRFVINTNPAIGADFNPRSWRLTRAQCQVIAGGVVMSRNVQSFLDTVPTPLGTGWAVVSPQPVDSLEGLNVGFFAGLTGLDRIGLGRTLRDAGARVRIFSSAAQLESAIAAGEVDAGVTETLAARGLGGENDWTVQLMPEGIERYQLGFGIWRGDLTLLKAIEGAIAAMQREGFLDALAEKYDIAPVSGTLGVPA